MYDVCIGYAYMHDWINICTIIYNYYNTSRKAWCNVELVSCLIILTTQSKPLPAFQFIKKPLRYK